MKQGWQELIGDTSHNGILFVDVLIIERPHRLTQMHIVAGLAGKCTPSLVCGMQVCGTVTLLGPGQDAKTYPSGKFWGFGTLCDSKKCVRLVASEPLWVFPSSVELLDADVANIGYFLNFRCDASELSARNSYLGVCECEIRFKSKSLHGKCHGMVAHIPQY